MNHIVIFTDDRMTISAENLLRSASVNGVNTGKIYKPQDLPQLFVEMASPTLNVPKGGGLYIWKGFVVWDYLTKMPEGDFLIYADAGQTIISNVQAVINQMTDDVMLFSNGWDTQDWTKSDVSHRICPDVDLRHKKQVQASLIFIRNTEKARNFIKEWMLYCLMPGVCDNSPSVKPNVLTFAETRWDQSVLSMLQLRDGLPLHWFPSATNFHNKSDHPSDGYPAIVDHHRKRNPGATNGTDSEW